MPIPTARTLRELQSIATSSASTVLITGESGTGTSTIARLLHDSGPQTEGPSVEIDCAEARGDLVRDLLFGRERSAYSEGGRRELGLVELASGGILFVDNVDELALASQGRFFTFLEQRAFRRCSRGCFSSA
jgi:DNA-binding NtrC family response regulator